MRVSKTQGNTTQKYYWDRGYIANEGTGNTITASNYIGADGIIARKENNVVNYLVKNAHGDVIKYVGASNTKHYDYDPYGNELNANANDENPFRYAGEYFDAESGQIYLRNRYYSPATGRFTQEDPIRDGTNWYVYCAGNPVMYVDPWGLYDRDKAVQYATQWSNGTNSEEYERFDTFAAFITSFGRMRGDCANFVSQCLVAGGLEMNSNWHYNIQEVIDWHGNSYVNKKERDMTSSWAAAQAQFDFFSSEWAGYQNGETLQIWTQEGMEYNIRYHNIQPGDLMFFAHKDTGVVYHSVIITSVTENEIMYSAHTSERLNEPLSAHLDDDFVYIVRIRDDAILGYTT